MRKKAVMVFFTVLFGFALGSCNGEQEESGIPPVVRCEYMVEAINKASEKMRLIAINYRDDLIVKSDNTLWGGRWAITLTDERIARGMTGQPIKLMENVASVVAHRHVTLVLKTNNSLWTRGENRVRQFGDLPEIYRFTPRHLWDDVAVVAYQRGWIYAIKTDGRLYVRGIGFVDDESWCSSVVNVSAGIAKALVVTECGNLWAMGRHKYTSRHERLEPRFIMNDVTAVSTGLLHSTAIRADGSLWAWGWNVYGELGIGEMEERFYQEYPTRIMADVVAVLAGHYNTFAIRADGSLWGWGCNWSGQLGDGTQINRHSPVKIMDDVIAVSSFSTVETSADIGSAHTIAIRSDGSLWWWGWGEQLYPKMIEGINLFVD